MPTEDYLSAAFRHLRDATLLEESLCFDNAAYLAGYTIECSLKLILESGQDSSVRRYGHDLATLGGPALDLAVLLSPVLRRYRPAEIEEILDACRQWHPEWRYSASGDVASTVAHRIVEAATKAVDLLAIPVVLDGWREPPR